MLKTKIQRMFIVTYTSFEYFGYLKIQRTNSSFSNGKKFMQHIFKGLNSSMKNYLGF